MATKQPTKPAASPPAKSPLQLALANYARQTRRPLASLAFVLPLLLLYEGGILFLGSQAVRNGVDVWLRGLLDTIGLTQYFLLPALCIALLLAWHYLTRDRWQLQATALYVMFAECAVWGLALLVIGRVEGIVAAGALSGGEPVTMDVPFTLGPRGVMLGRMLGFVGAGVYEELLFRLLLIPPIAIFAKHLGAKPGVSIALAVVLTSVVFSAAHYLGPMGENFDAFSFSFRLTAGAFFALVFVYRGFGIAAGTHALYDVFVSLG